MVDWDREYRDGKWEGLRNPTEETRNAILAGCIVGHDLTARRRVLDLGSGPGILREYLPDSAIDEFVGVDLSAGAVEQAELQGHDRSVFVAASVEDWEPDGAYDVIVFNEVLNVLAQPVAVVDRFAGAVKSGGFILVSMWNPPISITGRPTNIRARLRYPRIWRALGQRFEVVNDIVVKQHGRRRWRIQKLQPRTR